MKNNVNRKNINVDKQNIIPLWNFKQEDDAILKLALYKGAIPFDITGQTIVLGAKRPNNTVVEQTDGFTINGNEIDIALKNNILAANGLVELDLQITDANGKLTTASFFITVAKKVLGENNLNASNDISAINQLVADLQAKTEEVNNAISTIEPKANQLMNDIQTDYNSLQKIIIDENQAANLQGQITDLGSQLDTNVKELNKVKNRIVSIYDLATINETTDIGAIINKYTEEYTIYLPNGIYRVDTPIVLKNSLIGCNVSRNTKVDTSATWLVSNIDSGSLISINGISESCTVVDNINIRLNSSEIGINFNPSIYTFSHIKNVNIVNVSNIGINLEPGIGLSRGCFCDNISIFGTAFTPSIGINVSHNCYDCRFSNIEIMGVQRGIIFANIDTIHYLSNVHIWTGHISGISNVTDNNWWRETRGIEAAGKNKIFCNNLYLDTCFIPLVCKNNATIYINNLIYWEDKSILETETDGSLVYYNNVDTKSNVIVNGGMIYTGTHLGFISNKRTKLNDVEFIVNLNEITTNNYNKLQFEYNNLDYEYNIVKGDVSDYRQIACAKVEGAGYLEIDVFLGGGQHIKIHIKNDWSNGLRITGTMDTIYHEFYYKTVTIENETFVEIYTFINVDITVNVKSATINNIIPINIGNTIKLSDYNTLTYTQSQTDTTGLILIYEDPTKTNY